MRYVAEASGAVLDTKTSLRTWYDSHAEAIRAVIAANFDHINQSAEDAANADFINIL